ncbi:MAG: transcription elongation factor GreA [Ignavibacteriales bacterium]|nr:MAG: transcription elongation factor GreA [Ignavibacteriaceae bacterium]MBW7871919.1 transcription elongation factor GreA [Ignavibacteria bacterium]MCZ2144230.1 transcription elongation factor GreA [Ignavibacteriales bacterium]OQY78843.1 MAG: transcription elongation factor GreA [Ignavibacteriales bacterium UTCHB3]MBV6446184.1 Transcription elongation factor GreA [Ignavibacteriaceae bacterium]
MQDYVYLSQERLLELEKELAEMKSTGRKEIAVKIAEARAHGDLSENAEYDAAKEEQGLFELKIHKLETLLMKAQIIDPNSLSKDKVHILATVKIKNLKTKKVIEYQLVSNEEADLQQGKISVSSPVGQGLLGKKVGEIAQVKAPAGLIEFEILEIK